MRERINRAAKGEFSYDTPHVTVSEKEIHIEVNAGETTEGTFTVSSPKSHVIRGMVQSDCHFMEFLETVFEGEQNEIRYLFHAEFLTPCDTMKGNIQIISDCGTCSVPFHVTVGVPACEVSTGKIRDLFHFTNLAKEDPKEASALFRNPHFEEVFLFRDNANIALYQGLVKGTSKGMAMEEFLIAIHKKLPIVLSVNKTNFEYSDCSDSFTDHFRITKNNWGYGEYRIESDCAFLVPERKMIWSDDFMGDSYSMPFLVDVQKMIPGKNFGKITISNVAQKIEIYVTASRKEENKELSYERKQSRRCIFELMRLHLKFCMGRMTSQDYIKEIGKNVYSMEKTDMSVVTQLFRIHLAIMEHNDSAVKIGLAVLEEQKEELKKTNTVYYCAYEYLKGLWAEEDETVQSCVREIEACYAKESDNWRLLWFLLYLSTEYQAERKKYQVLYRQLHGKCNSPLIFLEVCSVLNDNPEMLTELSPGICMAIHWGCRENYLNKEAALRYSYLAGKMRSFSKVVWKDLCRFYEQFEDLEILTAICKLLMQGQITNQKAFYWYSLGVEYNLKLTDLYEYYMYSIDEEQEMNLNNSTLLYFLYDNHLTVNKKAMLYAYVIRNKELNEDTYEAYKPMMEEFALRQLSAGRINSNLAVLYEEFIQEDKVDETLARQLPNVMFCHEIICGNQEMVGAYVTHRELEGESFVPFVNGKAVVEIFTENYQVFLADKLDNRYTLSIDYTTNKLFEADHLAMKCFEKNGEDARLLLFLYDRAERLNQQGSEIMDIRRKVLQIPNLSTYHYKKGFEALVRYYYDNFEGELLDAVLSELDWSMIDAAKAGEFVEYCAVRRFFDKAMEGIFYYGYEKISAKRLLKISSDTFAREADREDSRLVKLAWHIFFHGSFDENIMRYLCRHYMGSIHDMTQIWKYAKGFVIDTADFTERILGQIVFTGEISPDSYEVFYEYYESGKDKRLVLAFLKYTAYNYLVKNWMIPSRMFAYYYKEVLVQDNLFCLIASLKYLSGKKDLSAEEVKFAEYNLNKLYEKKIVFPFYREFHGKVSLPIHVLDEYYVEYKANPEYEVKIHYLISSGYKEGTYVTEMMRDVFQGIRVKEFVLFQDEILQYYITENRPEGEVITQSVSVGFDETMDKERTSSRYHMLNLMMIAREMNDEDTLVKLMQEYVELKDSVNILFKPM